MNTKKKVLAFTVKLSILALISLPVYLLSLLFVIPSLLDLEETRLIIVVVLSRILEELLYITVCKSFKEIFIEESKNKKN